MVMDRIDNSNETANKPAKPAALISHLAVRDDGAILVSLEDAGNRDLTGREVISFLVLTPEEGARVRGTVEEGAYTAATNILGKLPSLPKTTVDA
jgi:hypothetical protein